jgi:hypothetical protein
MYTVRHNNVFFALLGISFSHYGHCQVNIVQKFKKGWLHIHIVNTTVNRMPYILTYYALYVNNLH